MIEQADGLLVLLAVAILVAELFPVEIPDGDGEVSFSTTFAFALLLTDGVAAVVLVHALALAIADAACAAARSSGSCSTSPSTRSAGPSPAGCWSRSPATCPTRTACSTSSCSYVPALVATAAVFLAINTALASTPPALARGTSPCG